MLRSFASRHSLKESVFLRIAKWFAPPYLRRRWGSSGFVRVVPLRHIDLPRLQWPGGIEGNGIALIMAPCDLDLLDMDFGFTDLDTMRICLWNTNHVCNVPYVCQEENVIVYITSWICWLTCVCTYTLTCACLALTRRVRRGRQPAGAVCPSTWASTASDGVPSHPGSTIRGTAGEVILVFKFVNGSGRIYADCCRNGGCRHRD